MNEPYLVLYNVDTEHVESASFFRGMVDYEERIPECG